MQQRRRGAPGDALELGIERLPHKTEGGLPPAAPSGRSSCFEDGGVVLAPVEPESVTILSSSTLFSIIARIVCARTESRHSRHKLGCAAVSSTLPVAEVVNVIDQLCCHLLKPSLDGQHERRP